MLFATPSRPLLLCGAPNPTQCRRGRDTGCGAYQEQHRGLAYKEHKLYTSYSVATTPLGDANKTGTNRQPSNLYPGNTPVMHTLAMLCVSCGGMESGRGRVSAAPSFLVVRTQRFSKHRPKKSLAFHMKEKNRAIRSYLRQKTLGVPPRESDSHLTVSAVAQS